MQFGNLLQASIVGVAAIAAVVALYFLKLRRRSQVVSSTMLWQKSIEDLKVNSPFQRLRLSLLLLLQVLLLALAAWALARPMMWLQQRPGKDIVFVLDNSASMNATDVPGGRLAEARRQLIEAIDNMASGDEARIITCGGEPSVPGSFTPSKEELRIQAKAVEPTDCRTNMHDALAIALSLANMRIKEAEQLKAASVRQAEVRIFSDGGFDDVADVSRGKADVIYHPVGTAAARNMAITNLDARHQPGTNRSVVFAAVQNLSATEERAALKVYHEGKLLDTDVVALKPGEQQSRVFGNLPIEEGVVELLLDAEDSLATDNRAWVSLRSSRDDKVLLVTEGNYFLRRALDQPGRTVDTVEPAQYKPSTDYDVVVFDRFAPDKLPDGNFLFFSQPPPLGQEVEIKKVKTPIVTDVEENHPVARHASLWELQPAECTQFAPPPQAQVIVESDEGPLVWVTAGPEGRMIYVAFDIFYTYNNWPLRVTFPLFVANAMEWLGQGAGRRANPLARTGDIIALSVEAGVAAVDFSGPGGIAERAVVSNRRAAFGGTHKIGIYTVEPLGGKVPRHTVAVNLLDPQESKIEVREEWSLKGVPVTQGGLPGRVNREIWWWFALAAFALLVAEWWTYHRRVFA